MSDNPLGQATNYPCNYDPQLLMGIPRAENRTILNIEENKLPFQGADIWNAYELSWLNLKGKPQAGLGRFVFSCDSPKIVESKSLKLYLNSFNNEAFESPAVLSSLVHKDLSKITGKEVNVDIELLAATATVIDAPDGFCLDELDLDIDCYEPSKTLLALDGKEELFEQIVDEVLYTNLFRSNCPITNQPDWASVTICYRGKKISHSALLKYLISYRHHNGYHENCVEAIFQDIQSVCTPEALSVEANFLRRGGIDINPVRTTENLLSYKNFPRFIRQ